MKRKIFVLLFSVGVFVVGLQGCNAHSDPLSTEDQYGYCDNAGLNTQLGTLPLQSLSESETASLLRMREEEKLARDVYTQMYDTWGSMVFYNIAQSEQTHMDAMLVLLQRYALTDPASASPGVFRDTTLAKLYQQLVAQGKQSLTDALLVGATIEDLDIADLKLQNKIDNSDITLVYDNLSRGSRNHMRAFVRNLSTYGKSYTPSYISQQEFNAIIASDTERGRCGN